ncbi:hypothetical protein J2X36_003210 [Methylobacterium sp. BE186]|nr:hypothetical protein [Methylobacterium sp. BE186]
MSKRPTWKVRAMPRLPTILVALSLTAALSAGMWGAILVAMQGPFE